MNPWEMDWPAQPVNLVMPKTQQAKAVGAAQVYGNQPMPWEMEWQAPPLPQAAPQQSVGTFEDVAKTIGSAGLKGAASVPMWLGDIANQAVAGPQYLYEGLVGQDRKDFQPAQPFFSSSDVVNGAGLGYQPQTDVGKIVEIPAQITGSLLAAKKAPDIAKSIGNMAGDTSSGVSMGKATMGASNLAESTAQGAKNVVTGATARNVDTLDEVAGAIKGQASTSYKAMRDAGAVIAPKAKSNVFQAIENDVKATGPLQKDLHSGYIGVMKDFKNALKNPDMGLEELDQYRQLFRDVANRNYVKGKPNGDAMKAQTAISAMDKVINRFGKADIKGGNPDAVQHLLAGRDNWAKASRFEAITDIIRRSGGNINKLKTDIFKFASNKNNIRGWTPEEISALKDAAKNSTGEAVLKAFGTLGFDIMKPVSGGSNVIPALEATAAMAQAPYAAPMLAGGTAAKTTQGFLGRGKVENLLKTLERRGK